MKAKPSAASRTIQTSLVLPSDTNQHGTIFGGTMMSYIDEVAAIAAMKHCRTTVVTASIDSIDFLSPVKMGHSLCIEAFVTATGTTSMEVFVKIISEDLQTGERQLTATSFLTFVAVDERGRPVAVPPVYPQSTEEQELFQSASERRRMREARRANSKRMIDHLDLTHRS